MAKDGSVIIEITGDSSDLLKELSNIKSELESAKQQEKELVANTSSIGSAAKAAAKVATAAFAAVSTAVAGAAAYAITAGSNFEAAMSNVAAISGATGEDLEALEATAMEMGATTQFSATEAANALSYMALAGWDAQQSIDALPGILDLAAASGMDLASASDMVTDYLSAFGMEAGDSAYFADMLAHAQSNANTTAAALGESFKNCAANMNAAGQDVETTTSLLSMLANQGSKGSEAGTKLAAVMRDLTAKMEEGAIAIGDTKVQVMDAQGNFRDLTDILLDVETATDGMGDAEKSAALSATFTADSISGLNMILNAGVDEAAAFEEELRNSAGTASNMADTMNDNLKGRITELGSALEGVGIQAYNAMEGPLKRGVESAIDSIGTLSDEMSNGRLKDSAEKIAEGFGSIVQVAGKLAEKALPAVVNGFADVVDHGEQVVTVAGAIAAAYAGFKATTKVVQPLTKAWKAATVALEAHEAASRLTMVAMNGGLPITTTLVGVLTGKITLATAAQAAWNKVALINPYILVGAAIAAVVVGIGLLIASQEKEVAAYQEVVDSVYEERDALDELKESREEAISSNLAEIDNAEVLIYQYKQLADKTGIVREGTDEYARAKSLANQINAVAPGAIEDLEDENGAYLQICDSIDLLIAKKRAEALAEANQESYQTAIQNRQSYVETIAELDKQLIAAQQEVEDAETAYAKNSSDYNADRVKNAREAVDEINAARDEEVQHLTEAEQTIAWQEELLAAAESGNIDQLKAAIQGYGNSLIEATNNNREACEAQAEQWKTTYETIKALQDEGKINDQAWVDSIYDTWQQSEQIAQTARDAEVAATEEHAADMEAAWGEVNSGILDKIKEIYPELEAAGGDLDTYYGDGIMANMAAGSDAAKAVTLAAKMAAMIEAKGANEAGRQFAAGLLNGMIEDSGLPEDAAREVMQTCLDAAAETAEINSPSRITTEQGMYLDQGWGNGITENAGLATEPVSALMQSIIDAASSGLSNATMLGSNFVSFLSSGISSNSGTAKTAGSSVAFSAASGASGQKNAFSTAGKTVGSSFSTGIQNIKSAVSSSAKIVATAGSTSASGQKSQYQTAGKTVTSAFQSGITGQKSAISTAAKAIAAAGHAAASATKTSWSTVGLNLAAGLARGISSGASSVISAAASIASKAITAAKNALGIHSPSKVAEKELGLRYDEGIAKGQEKNVNLVADASSNVASEAVNSAQETLNKTLSNPNVLTLDTVIAGNTFGVGNKLLSSVSERVNHMSAMMLENAQASASFGGAGNVYQIDYHPEQKCDEPVSARRLREINQENARQLGRTLKRV
ncbi:MAG: phage tail tape measure protein [Clostridia bacterium]|nr:phage tail tape measure protein [Clostridia bacterium]